MFGFSLVGSKVFFSHSFEEVLWLAAYIASFCCFLSWFFYFTPFLYFSYIILFVLPCSFWNTCFRIARVILQLSIQNLKITVFCNKSNRKVNLYNMASVQCKYHFQKKCSYLNCVAFFNELVFIFIWIFEQAFKLLTLTSEILKYLIYFNRH